MASSELSPRSGSSPFISWSRAAAPLYLRSQGRLTPQALGISVLAILAMSAALLGNLYPVPDAPYSYLPYLYAVLLLDRLRMVHHLERPAAFVRRSDPSGFSALPMRQTKSAMNSRDRELGMDRPIKRRDFLNGVAVAIGAPLLGLSPAAGSNLAQRTYPPTLTGMRGLYPGSFTTAHALRDHTFWNHADKPSDTGERYDLVIVGGGISGLSAAYFYQKNRGRTTRAF